jgi:hypothetical protein
MRFLAPLEFAINMILRLSLLLLVVAGTEDNLTLDDIVVGVHTSLFTLARAQLLVKTWFPRFPNHVLAATDSIDAICAKSSTVVRLSLQGRPRVSFPVVVFSESAHFAAMW